MGKERGEKGTDGLGVDRDADDAVGVFDGVVKDKDVRSARVDGRPLVRGAIEVVGRSHGRVDRRLTGSARVAARCTKSLASAEGQAQNAARGERGGRTRSSFFGVWALEGGGEGADGLCFLWGGQKGRV